MNEEEEHVKTNSKKNVKSNTHDLESLFTVEISDEEDFKQHTSTTIEKATINSDKDSEFISLGKRSSSSANIMDEEQTKASSKRASGQKSKSRAGSSKKKSIASFEDQLTITTEINIEASTNTSVSRSGSASLNKENANFLINEATPVVLAADLKEANKARRKPMKPRASKKIK